MSWTHLDNALKNWPSPEAHAELRALREVEKWARKYVTSHSGMRTILQSADHADMYRNAGLALDEALAKLDALMGGRSDGA